MADTFKGIITADGKKRQLPYRNVIETPVSDETLSIQGAFADSKAVGDRFKEVNAETSSLKEDLTNFAKNGEYLLVNSWELGAFDGSTGIDRPSTKRIITKKTVLNASSVTVVLEKDYRVFIGYFVGTNWNIIGWKTDEYTFEPVYGAEYRFQFVKITEEDVPSVSEYASKIKIKMTESYAEKAFSKANTANDNATNALKAIKQIAEIKKITVSDEVLRKNIAKSMLNDGTLISYDGCWVSDFINIDGKFIKEIYAASAISIAEGRTALVSFYSDANENSFISCIPTSEGIVDGGNWRYIDSVTVPDDAKFIRLAGANYTKYYNKLVYEIVERYKKEPYADDTIYFKIHVNKNFPNDNSTEMSEQDTYSDSWTWCALRLPASYTQYGKPCKLAVFCHGAGEAGIIDGDTDTAVAFKRDSEEFVQAGYAVFDITGNNQEYFQHMGSMRSMSAYKKAYEYIVDHYNVEREIYVMGQSMGGLTALNFCQFNKNIVRACAVAYPVTDLKGQAWDMPWFDSSSNDPTRVALAREYNFNSYETYKTSGNILDLVYEEEKVKGFSPIDNDSIYVDGVRYNGFPCPVKIIHGTSDSTVNYESSVRLINAIKSRGGFAEIRTVSGLAHTIYSWLRHEMLLFINRF